jgi:hypothetical protein
VADAPDPRGRAYRGADLTVFFDARRCIHATECVRATPDPAVPARIEREPGGPLHVRGDFVVATAEGERRLLRATLCACGKTGHAPFCDGSHREA